MKKTLARIPPPSHLQRKVTLIFTYSVYVETNSLLHLKSTYPSVIQTPTSNQRCTQVFIQVYPGLYPTKIDVVEAILLRFLRLCFLRSKFHKFNFFICCSSKAVYKGCRHYSVSVMVDIFGRSVTETLRGKQGPRGIRGGIKDICTWFPAGALSQFRKHEETACFLLENLSTDIIKEGSKIKE